MEAITQWLGTWGQILAFFVQMAYFIAIAVSAVWAVLLFKRFVDSRTTGTSTGAASGDDASDEAGDEADVAVDEFVD